MIDEYFAELIQYLYPGSEPLKDFTLVNHRDGKGTQIEEWNLPDPIPTRKELEDALVIHKDTLDQKRQARLNQPSDKEVMNALLQAINIDAISDPNVKDVLQRKLASE